METTTYKQRTREEVMAWLQKARERKDAFHTVRNLSPVRALDIKTFRRVIA